LPTPSPSFGIVGRDLEESLFDLTCPAGSSGASVPANANATLIANNNTAVASSSSISNLTNTTTQRTNFASPDRHANLTSSSSNNTHPSHADHSTASVFTSNVPAILASLPAIVASNPSIIKKLPSLLAANPDLIAQVDGLNFTEMAVQYNVAPVYVDMLRGAIKEAKKHHPKDVINGAESIVAILRNGDGA
jgi:hypothetical protein